MMGLFRKVDWQLIVPVFILVAISLATIFSVNGALFRNQLLFVCAACLLFLFFAHTDLSVWLEHSKLIYIVSLIGLGLLLVVGFETRGAVRWLSFLGFSLQFSEVFKPFLAVGLAAFLAKREERSFSTFVSVFLLLFPVAFLIFRQPDLGSALMYVLATALTLALFGFPLWWFGAMVAGVGASIPIVFRFLHTYQQQRLLTFFHLTNDPLGISYNAIQAVIAVGSGMFVGKGLGMGTQSGLRFLPERHTDFIFATLSEDLGFLGALIVTLAFCFLFYRLFVIFRSCERVEEKLFVAATFSLLFVQFFVNIGMNIGLMPIVGVPLPFVSYGGSSLLSNAIFLGLASGVASSIKRKSVLEIR